MSKLLRIQGAKGYTELGLRLHLQKGFFGPGWVGPCRKEERVISTDANVQRGLMMCEGQAGRSKRGRASEASI